MRRSSYLTEVMYGEVRTNVFQIRIHHCYCLDPGIGTMLLEYLMYERKMFFHKTRKPLIECKMSLNQEGVAKLNRNQLNNYYYWYYIK